MFNAKPKQEDILKCVSSSKAKTIKCIDELNKKTNYNEHHAKAGHCIANKCPGIYNNTISNLLKNTNTKVQKLAHSSTSQINNKVNTKCKKESDNGNNIFFKNNECNKKYDTYDEQNKCRGTDVKGLVKNYTKVLKNYLKCAQRYASKSKPSMLNKSKKSKKK